MSETKLDEAALDHARLVYEMFRGESCDARSLEAALKAYLAAPPAPVEGPLIEHARLRGIEAAAAVNERIQAGQNFAPVDAYIAAVDAVFAVILDEVEAFKHAFAPGDGSVGWSWCDRLATHLRVGAPSGWRPEVRAFADLMEAKLRANDHKPGWKADNPFDLAKRIHHELSELEGELGRALNKTWWPIREDEREPWSFHRNHTYRFGDEAERSLALSKIGPEAADVANFAMMIADVCGALPITRTDGES